MGICLALVKKALLQTGKSAVVKETANAITSINKDGLIVKTFKKTGTKVTNLGGGDKLLEPGNGTHLDKLGVLGIKSETQLGKSGKLYTIWYKGGERPIQRLQANEAKGVFIMADGLSKFATNVTNPIKSALQMMFKSF